MGGTRGIMTKKVRRNQGKSKASRPVFLSFEFEKDGGRRGTFIGEGKRHCEFVLEDKSLPAAEHDDKWRRAVRERMRVSDVVIVLLGPDTHNAPGVKDELSLAWRSGVSSSPADAAGPELWLGREERGCLQVPMERHQSNAAGTSEVRNNIGKPRQVIAESLDGVCRTGETRITALGPVQVINVRPW